MFDMNDPRAAIIKALVVAVKNATGLGCYTRIPKQTNGQTVYPFVYLSDMYLEEDGPKRDYHYSVTPVLQLQYKDQTDLSTFYEKMAAIMGIINNNDSLTLSAPFKVEEMKLESSTTTEFEDESGIVNVGVIRIALLVSEQ